MADEIAPSEEVRAAQVAAEQRGHLRRILASFIAVVLLLPLAGIGGSWAWLLIPILLVAAHALREALRLRRSVRDHGNLAQRPR